MSFPRFRIRTLMIAVAVVAVVLFGLGVLIDLHPIIIFGYLLLFLLITLAVAGLLAFRFLFMPSDPPPPE